MNHNGKDIPMYFVGHAHLDPLWQWQWQEGSAEAKATLRSALDRMKEFPEFRFVCSSALLFHWIKEFSPSMFAEIKQRIDEGRFIIVGGWYIQPDCNMPSGEGFVRQALYSQRFFKENFGVTAEIGYSIDSFGQNLMLPQILKKSGMPYYVYQRPSEEENPMNDLYLFDWVSPDGSSVRTYHLRVDNWLEYDFFNPEFTEEELCSKIDSISRFAEKDGVPILFFYGVCNHGGGPTIKDLNSIRAYKAHNPTAEIIYSDIMDYFTAVERSGIPIQKYDKELQHFASGAYAGVCDLKNRLRRCEQNLLAAEIYSVLGTKLCGKSKRNAAFEAAWKNVCLLHFHDVVAGCASKKVYEDTVYIAGMALNTAAVEENNALQTISWAIDTAGDKEKGVPLVLFNPNGFDAEELVQINTHCKGVTDSEGNSLPIQSVHSCSHCYPNRKDIIFKARVPALGYAVYYLQETNRFGHPPYREFVIEEGYPSAVILRSYRSAEEGVERFTEADSNTVKTKLASVYGAAVLENEIYHIEFELHTGYIVSFVDKRTGRELISDRAAVPVVVDEFYSDSWGINHTYYTDFMARFGDAKVSVTESGSVRATVKVVSRYNDSTLVQYFSLEPNSDRLQVRAFVDWHEKHKMLKLAWPFNLQNPKTYYEIPFGVIERPANKEEEPGLTWIAMKDETGGFAIVNNNTYSAHADGNVLYHTILRSPLYIDGGAHRTSENEHDYSAQGRFDFSYTLMPVQDSWVPVIRAARQLNKPVTQIMENWHEGYISDKVYRGLHIDKDNIMLSACKHSEDGTGLILRLYETDGVKTTVTVSGDLLPIPLTAEFGGYSVNTYYLADGASEWKEVLMTEFDM